MSHLSNDAKKAQAEYMREWRRKNIDRVCENNRRYWERKAAQRKEESSNAEKNNQP